jgi:D-alanine-D-alanine ligase
MAVSKLQTSPLRVAVLMGGESAERMVSLASGQAVMAALAAAGHVVEPLDPASADLAMIDWYRFDVGFIALHGGAGEDGRVQSLLDSLGVCYTGSGSAASRLAMSKSAAKDRFAATGVPTVPHVVQRSSFHFPASNGINPVLRRLPLPVVVKPDRQGSSLGVGYAATAAELAERIAVAQEFDSAVIVEPWIDGREFTVAVLGRDALPLLEILSPRGLFDYEAKYESSLTEYRFDHGLPQRCAEAIRDVAVAAAEALGTSGLVRVDLMLDREGRPWVLEVNTVPGMTEHSLAPKAADQAGLSMAALCDWMLRDAMDFGRRCVYEPKLWLGQSLGC